MKYRAVAVALMCLGSIPVLAQSPNDREGQPRPAGGLAVTSVLLQPCNGKIFVPNLSGETIVFEASADGYREVARNKLGSDSYSCMAIAGGEVFMRVGNSQGQQRTEKLVRIRSHSQPAYSQ